jgi:hypothetical protein
VRPGDYEGPDQVPDPWFGRLFNALVVTLCVVTAPIGWAARLVGL